MNKHYCNTNGYIFTSDIILVDFTETNVYGFKAQLRVFLNHHLKKTLTNNCKILNANFNLNGDLVIINRSRCYLRNSLEVNEL